MVKGPEIWFVKPRVLKPREFIRSLLGRIQGTRHLVHYTGGLLNWDSTVLQLQIHFWQSVGTSNDYNQKLFC